MALAAADFNDDGKLDIAVADGTSSAVAVLLGNGTGSFPLADRQTITVADVGKLLSIAVADVNKDGVIDLVVGGETGVQVLFGDGVPPTAE